MLRQVGCLYTRFNFLSVIHLLLLLHFSTLIFISNMDTIEFTNSKPLYCHSSRQINNIVINEIVRRKNKRLKISTIQKDNLISTASKSSITSDSICINFSEFTFLKFEEFINNYIEFRPPPGFLS